MTSARSSPHNKPVCFGTDYDVLDTMCKFCPMRLACESACVEASRVETYAPAATPAPAPAPAPPRAPAPAPAPAPTPAQARAPTQQGSAVPPPTAYTRPAAPAYSYYQQPARPGVATQPAQTTGPSALIRPAKFNHQKPLLQQYGNYVMYDVAEVLASRAVDLIRSCRDEYERELLEPPK